MRRARLRRAAITLTRVEELEHLASQARPLTPDSPAGDERADELWEAENARYARLAAHLRSRIHVPLELVAEHRRTDPLAAERCEHTRYRGAPWTR